MSNNIGDTCEPTKPSEVAEIITPPPDPEPILPCETDKKELNLQDGLPPDHPLLARFQQSLKEHLLRIKNQITGEIDELNHQIEVKEKEREDYGVKLYDRQQEIEKQNEILEEYSKNIQETVNKRIEDERQKAALQQEYDAKYSLTKQKKYQYNQRLIELGHLQSLENNIRKWTDEFQTELTSSKRVVSKDNQLQKVMAEEKQKADMMYYNLQVEVKKREEELEALDQQIADQTKLNNVLEANLSDANTDLEVLSKEHHRLTQAWGEVIVAIQHRDKVLFQAKQSLNKQQELLKLASASIEATKKQTAKETEKNEKLEAFQSRLMRDLNSLKGDTDKQAKVLAKLELKMQELPKILEQTERDYLEAKQEGHHLVIQLNGIQIKLEKQYSIKSDFEEAIFKIAQDQLLCDKASKYRLKVLSEHQESRRQMEDNLHKVEGSISALLLRLERQKTAILHLHDEGDKLTEQLKQLNEECDEINDEINEIQVQITIKLKLNEKLAKNLDDLTKDSMGTDVNPTEVKIKNYERAIHDIDAKVNEQKQFWLILQGHIVNLSHKRNSQLKDIQVARKQLMIINQKSLKIDNEMEETEKNTQEILRELQNYSTKLELLSAKDFEKKKQHANTESECELEHFQLLEKLKENEMRVLQLEQETLDLTDDIETHKNIVLERHREALSWETKYKLIEETLRWRRSESAFESEIGTMRSEIHRMEIRHKELKRAQEKLIQDLDFCVLHREKIFINASTKQKMEGVHFRSRTNIQQKINELKNKLKQVNYELGTAQRKLNELEAKQLELEHTKSGTQKEVSLESDKDKLLCIEIEQGVLLKHQNLESIVRKQQRAKQYRRLSDGAAKPKFLKSETALQVLTLKQTNLNTDLLNLVDTLLVQFPDKKFALTRVRQSLTG